MDQQKFFCNKQAIIFQECQDSRICIFQETNAVNYHAIHEAAVMGIVAKFTEDTKTNLANILEKFCQFQENKISRGYLYLLNNAQ